jgi:hypothetical protein
LEIIKNTQLWKRTLDVNIQDQYSDQRNELSTDLVKFRRNISHLVSQISKTLPDLTIHDISHLDALWENVSLIIGHEYPVNPLEAFIFGGAVLLHDSALSFEAYKDGINGVRNSKEWQDSFVLLTNEKKGVDEAELQKQADFIALRGLHAKQAGKLHEMKWKFPDRDEDQFLIQDATIRRNYGELMGLIASSHHWSIEDVISKLPKHAGAIGDFPQEWQIDPIKIACMLRCADASHLDSRRAPDFLFALLKRNGISYQHWNGQNKLAKMIIGKDDDETVIIASNTKFKEEESESWYVVYDAATVFDKELNSCNSILTSPFKIKNVKGVESPKSFSNYVQVESWEPSSLSIHVSNVKNLVTSMGGEVLYGSQSNLFGIAIRELIQNSRDAIKAREQFDSKFKGKISIRVYSKKDGMYLVIEDNGCGMSERVLLNTLLDFGTSLWVSDLIKEEFPGLVSSGFYPIGKFGIGFHSIFMIANKIYISSRRWEKGLDAVSTLKFENGFSLRPLHIKGKPESFSSSINTKIEIRLKDNFLSENFTAKVRFYRPQAEFKDIPLNKFLAFVCCGLDVNVFLEQQGATNLIHQNIVDEELDVKKWLYDIAFIDDEIIEKDEHSTSDIERVRWVSELARSGSLDQLQTKDYIDTNYQRLKHIYDVDKLIGFAAISTTRGNLTDNLSAFTNGGLASIFENRDGSNFIGFIDYPELSAKRDIQPYQNSYQEPLKLWAEKQNDELLKLSLNDMQRACVAYSLCTFGADPSRIAKIVVNKDRKDTFLSFDELVDLSLDEEIFFLYRNGVNLLEYTELDSLSGKLVIKPIKAGHFLAIELIEGIPVNNNSLLDCLYRKASNKGYSVSLIEKRNVGTGNFSMQLDALSFKSEKKIEFKEKAH